MLPLRVTRHFLIITLFILINPNLLTAQYSIMGKVSGTNEISPQYVNVLISNPADSTVILARSFEGSDFELSDIDTPHFLLKVSSLGFNDYHQTVEMQSSRVDLGRIVMSELTLEEVVVTAKKPLIERTAEGMVFNVAGSFYEQGLNGAELLSRTPTLQVSESAISVVGRSGVLVLINGRQTNMSGRQLVAYVRSLRSEDIEKVVVMTNPPAKYDAQGNSGVVNIVLNRRNGFNLDLSFDYTRATYNNYVSSLGISYSNDKIFTNLNISSFWEKKLFESEFDYIYSDYTRHTETERTDKSNPNSYFDFSVDYKLSEYSNIGLTAVSGYSDRESDYVSRTKYSNPGGVYNSIFMPSYSIDKNNYFGIYPYWDYKFGASGKTLKVEAGYFTSTSDSNIQLGQDDYLNDFEELTGSSFGVNNSLLDYDIYSIKGDLTLPFGKLGKTELGVKSTLIHNLSERKEYDSDEDFESVVNPLEDNFSTTENIYAVYLSHSAHLTKKLELRAGLRYEYTILNSSLNRSEYGRFFPSVSLAYAVTDEIQTNIGYNKRLNRPSIRQINPFRWYTNSIDYSMGNSSLGPEYMHNIDLGISYRTFNASFYWTSLIDGIETVHREEVNTGGYVSYPTNSLTDSRFGTNISYYLMSVKNLGVMFNLNFYLNSLQSSLEQYASATGNGYGGYLFISTSYKLSNKIGNGVSIFLGYQPPVSDNFSSSESFVYWSINYKHPLFNERVWASVSVSDPFRWSTNRNQYYYSDHTFNSYFYNDMQTLSISISYNFNNKKMRQVNRNVDRSSESLIK